MYLSRKLTFFPLSLSPQEVDDSASAHDTAERDRESGLPGGVGPVAKADVDKVRQHNVYTLFSVVCDPDGAQGM